MPLPMPKQVPKPGFYYHYKHDPNGPVNSYAYEVIGVGFHTEDDCRPGEEHFLIYRPLYNASVYKAKPLVGLDCFDARPLAMWMSNVEHGGQVIPRFTRITDAKVYEKLKVIRKQMYG